MLLQLVVVVVVAVAVVRRGGVVVVVCTAARVLAITFAATTFRVRMRMVAAVAMAVTVPVDVDVPKLFATAVQRHLKAFLDDFFLRADVHSTDVLRTTYSAAPHHEKKKQKQSNK